MSGVLFYNKCRIKTDVLTSIQLTEAEEKDVNFYDYDGFRLLSYTNAQALALTELPANPVINENLTFDEWNWTLAAIKSQINNVGGVVNVGAIYHTTDEKTHITCKPTETFPQAYICLTPTASNAVTVDWGDGTTDTWTSASQEIKSHTYTGVTDSSVYDIAISCSSGTYSFETYITGTESNNQNCVYTDIKLANTCTSCTENSFKSCYSLQSIAISDSLSGLGSYCFAACYSLKFINIPMTIQSFNNNCFTTCYSLVSIAIPCNATSFGDSCFSTCPSLNSITIPTGFSSFGYGCFSQCRSLSLINIPTGVSLGESCFSSCYSLQFITIPESAGELGAKCFNTCYSLKSITIPSSVTSVGEQCFYACYALNKIYLKPTVPPTLANQNAINNVNNTCLVIYVPTGTLSAYQSASVWSSFSSKMVEYSF